MGVLNEKRCNELFRIVKKSWAHLYKSEDDVIEESPVENEVSTKP